MRPGERFLRINRCFQAGVAWKDHRSQCVLIIMATGFGKNFMQKNARADRGRGYKKIGPRRLRRFASERLRREGMFIDRFARGGEAA